MPLSRRLVLSTHSIVKIEQLFGYRERLEEFCPKISCCVREDLLDIAPENIPRTRHSIVLLFVFLHTPQHCQTLFNVFVNLITLLTP